MPKDQRKHVLRPPLPWRDTSSLTECGHEALEAMTRAEFVAGLAEHGPQRMAILTCMTCFQTAQRWADWATDPRKALDREITWEVGWRDRGERLRDELLAVAELIERHRVEFDAIVAAEAGRREWRDRHKKQGRR